MSKCCILQCSARKSTNQPQLNLHRFPRNLLLKNKWIDAIGIQNINPRQKAWYVCSLHFEDSQFNKTLDVIRLHDDSVPSIFSKASSIQKTNILCEMSNNETTSIAPPGKLDSKIVEKLSPKGSLKRKNTDGSSSDSDEQDKVTTISHVSSSVHNHNRLYSAAGTT